MHRQLHLRRLPTAVVLQIFGLDGSLKWSGALAGGLDPVSLRMYYGPVQNRPDCLRFAAIINDILCVGWLHLFFNASNFSLASTIRTTTAKDATGLLEEPAITPTTGARLQPDGVSHAISENNWSVTGTESWPHYRINTLAQPGLHDRCRGRYGSDRSKDDPLNSTQI